MTQLEAARAGTITGRMRKVAKEEGVSPEVLRQRIAEGKVVIMGNTLRNPEPLGIGEGLRTKVNASIGTSTDIIDFDMEEEKARIAQKEGADTLMELSTGGDLDEIRRRILNTVSLPVGTVPLYQVASEAIKRYGAIVKAPKELFFEVLERQVEDGVDFMAVHCGINRLSVERLKKQGYRYGGLVSRGGAFLVAWMEYNNSENPYYEEFDRVVSILKKRDVVLSLGNGMRSGAVHDSNDRAQIQELIINCELADLARKEGVQTMVEGPGHIPIDEIEFNVKMAKKLSRGAPYYVLGPVPTDVFPGYDHIASVAGAALAAQYGADLICYLTPAEHIALPFPEDVRIGVRCARIAAHMGDMVKLGKRDKDLEMAVARKSLDWSKQFEIAVFKDTFQKIRNTRPPEAPDTCTMCGKHCALKIVREMFEH
ncbi:thiamine biosynthesis protein ThiC [Thermosulfidibacter takaii ABI70S6]|uniref:Phosphomethylpyrimidine synthase n=1 Tax=Thermosulfidibacter takaii (strain DSM 17441 / JCM 13301 / NBRC 103674 / ABI70S6) TaxID=1298851 RepID=A0A0S3QVG0_THET7|nr:phosphomethylpyrimidine synthase ThiC [Thermosulfidibacter takaii]BAT72315.1 thiamine biosynthesis protein ThiC [Thermosulfidibacter takaii ABI70S6]